MKTPRERCIEKQLEAQADTIRELEDKLRQARMGLNYYFQGYCDGGSYAKMKLSRSET